jgi:ribosomal protein L7/L12
MALPWIAGGLFGLLAAAFVIVSLRDVVYRRSGLLPAAGQATTADVERLVRAGHRILAIRCYREIHHVGLAKAKNAIDDLHI